jgi:hypothetical protein
MFGILMRLMFFESAALSLMSVMTLLIWVMSMLWS